MVNNITKTELVHRMRDMNKTNRKQKTTQNKNERMTVTET
jgi:hypothetical protein